VPEALMAALERRFLSEGQPRNITAVHPSARDGATLGANHFAHEGLLKRIVCGTFVTRRRSRTSRSPTRSKLHPAAGRAVELMREIAADAPA